MSRQRLSLTINEARVLLVAANHLEGRMERELTVQAVTLSRAQSKLARCFGLPDPYPELSLERAPRATPHRKPRKQSPELRERRVLAAKLVGARKVVRRIGPDAEQVIADWLQKGLATSVALAACQEIIRVHNQGLWKTPSARHAVETIVRILKEREARVL